MAGAGDHKGAGEEFVAGALHDVVLFAGDERFVDLDFPGGDAAVRRDLVAQGEDQEVALDQLAGGDLASLAAADDGGFLFGLEFEFVDGAFGADFVDDADQGVGEGDEDEKEVFIGADQDDKDGKDEVDEIEESESGFQDDARDGVGGGLFGQFIDLAGGDFGGDFFRGETGEFHGDIIAR